MSIKIEQKVVENISLKEILSDDNFNCRGSIIPMDVIELSRSIDKNGLLQPIVIQRYNKQAPYKYRIVSGHRRYLAYRVLGLESIPSLVIDTLSEQDALVLNLAENLKRKSLNIMQEARAIRRLEDQGYSEDLLIAELGMSRGWVQVRRIALKLPPEIQNVIETGLISQEQIRTLGSMKNKDLQFEAVRKIKDSKIKGEVIKLVRPKKNPLQKKQRNRAEIFEMMEIIQTAIGNGLFTRCLAWAAGEISDFELYRDVQTEAEERDIKFEIPKDILMILG